VVLQVLKFLKQSKTKFSTITSLFGVAGGILAAADKVVDQLKAMSVMIDTKEQISQVTAFCR
jgi:uncharacterized membrane protein